MCLRKRKTLLSLDLNLSLVKTKMPPGDVLGARMGEAMYVRLPQRRDEVKSLVDIRKHSVGNTEINAVLLRDLWEFLGIGKHYTDWAATQLRLFKEGLDYEILNNSNILPPFVNKGRPRIDHIVTLDVAKNIAMMSRTQKGAEVRDYFVECEKKLFSVSSIMSVLAKQSEVIAHLQRDNKMCVEELARIMGRVNVLEENLPPEDYFTIRAWCNREDVGISIKSRAVLGRAASRLSRERGVRIEKISNSSFGTLNVYHEDILIELFDVRSLMKLIPSEFQSV